MQAQKPLAIRLQVQAQKPTEATNASIEATGNQTT